MMNKAIGIIVAIAVVMGIASCQSSYDSPSKNTSQSASAIQSDKSESNSNSSSGSRDKGSASSKSPSSTAPRYEDSRWPTTDSSLLAIPESNRWYNAAGKAGTRCTVAGPVKSVDFHGEVSGKPVFVDIGATYPSSSRVTLVVWTDGDWSDFSSMLTDVDTEPNCWLEVTGNLENYNDHLQFTSNDSLSFRWWTNVQ